MCAASTILVASAGEGLTGFPFTYPRYRGLALAAEAEGPVVAMLARRGRDTVGMALAEIGAGGMATLHSLFVDEGARRQGIGSALFAALEVELARRGAAGLELGYMDGRPTSAAATAILARAGWPAPEMDRLVVRCDHGMGALDWIRNPRRGPTGAEIFPWAELREDEADALRREDWYGPMVDPFLLHGEPGFNSVGMRWRGRVVGWVLTEALDSQTLRYSRSFADPSLHRLGVITALYVDSIGQQLARPDVPYATWTVPRDYPAMLAFTRRWMVPLALSSEEWVVASRRYGA